MIVISSTGSLFNLRLTYICQESSFFRRRKIRYLGTFY